MTSATRRERILRASPALLRLWIGAVLGAACGFVAQMLLARMLSAQEFGEFSAGLGIVTLVSPFAGFGVAQFWLRVFGEEGWAAVRWVRPSLLFSSVSTSVVLLSLLGWAAMGIGTAATNRITALLSPLIVAALFVDLVNGKLQLEERFTFLGVWQLAPQFGRLLVTVLAIQSVESAQMQTVVALGYAGVALGLCFVGLTQTTALANGSLALKRHGARPIESGVHLAQEDSISWKRVAGGSWAYGAATLFYLLLTQSSVVVLAAVTEITEAGYFSIVLTVLTSVYLLPNVLYQKFLLPKVHRWAHHDRAELYASYRTGNRLMLALGVAAGVIVIGAGPPALLLLFGAKYEAAVLPLRIAAIAIPLRFVSMSVGAVLVTQEHMRWKVVVMGAVGVFNVIGCATLGKSYGALGAAVALVFSEVMLLVFYHQLVRRRVFSRAERSAQHARTPQE